MAADERRNAQRLQKEIAILSAEINNYKICVNNQRGQQRYGPYSQKPFSITKGISRGGYQYHKHSYQQPSYYWNYTHKIGSQDSYHLYKNHPATLTKLTKSTLCNSLNNTIATNGIKIVSNAESQSHDCDVSNKLLGNKGNHPTSNCSVGSTTSVATCQHSPTKKSNFSIDKRKCPKPLASKPVISKSSAYNAHIQTVLRKSLTKPTHQKSSSFKLVNKGKVKTTNAADFVNQVMGRSVKNASNNKFKFVKKREQEDLLLPSKSSFSLDRRLSCAKSRSPRIKRQSSLVMVNGRVVKSDERNRVVSRTRIRTTVRLPSDSRKMKVDRRQFRTPVKSSDCQRMAQSVLNRSRQIVQKANRKKKIDKKHCTFFNRFGECKRGADCPYVHDKSKVAVCRRFLQGKCLFKDCSFSHHVTKEKMPVCSYYLRGLCTREDCPYLHVHVNKEAKVCQEFLDGRCSLGVKCEKQHTLVCQTYVRTGQCPDLPKCRLKHPQKRRKSMTKEMRIRAPPSDEVLKPGQMPSFIRLDSDMDDSDTRIHEMPSTSGLQIRPIFGDL